MDIILYAYVISYCIVFETMDKHHRRSRNLYVDLGTLRSWMINPVGEFAYFDLNRYIRIRALDEQLIRVELGWIGGSDDKITGYRQSFYMPMHRLQELCDAQTSETVRTLVHTERNSCHAHIVLTANAAAKMNRLDAAHHRAFCLTLMQSFWWGSDTTIEIYSDFGSDFSFSDGKMYGGICLHEKSIVGSDGSTYIKPVYGIHT